MKKLKKISITLTFAAMIAVAGAQAVPTTKVTICHKFGTSDENTLVVGYPASVSHVREHGDFFGTCPQNDQLIDNVEMYEIKFDPYFIGRQQQDNLIVVNQFDEDQPYSLRVVVTAYDPFTGDRLDNKRVDFIPAGRGTSIVITDTHPEPHASQLVVQVEVFHDDTGISVEGDGQSADIIPDRPFSITRILTTQRDATVLQIKGVPRLLNGDLY